MSHYSRPEARLYRFLREVYGDLPPMTRIEVDVDALSGGVHGTPHLEATEIRAYAGDEQLLPDFETPYWKEILAAYPGLFRACTTRQDRLDAVQELLERERLYLEYGLDWPDVGEKVISPLSFTIAELRQSACHETAGAEMPLEDGGADADDEEDRARSPEDAIAYAESALETLSHEWMQNVFGEGATDVLFDAVNAFTAMMRLHLALREREISPFAKIFHALWDDPDRRESLLKNVRHEQSRGWSPVNITALVWQALQGANLTASSDFNLREADLSPLVDFLDAYVGQTKLPPRTVEETLAFLERDLQGCTKTVERAAAVGITLSPPLAAGDVLSWVLCEAKKLEEQAMGAPELREELMMQVMRLRRYQACLNCLGVEPTEMLFQLRDADLPQGTNDAQDSGDKPRVTATCISGDNRLRVEQIDVTPWFRRATEEQLFALYEEGWSDGEVSDSVAVYAALYDQRVRNLLSYVDAGGIKGILCLVNQREAFAWMGATNSSALEAIAKEEGLSVQDLLKTKGPA